MKKNIAMRVAAFLFILTMISTCAFATTFAKYTTSGKAEDSARVAKWGVTVSMTGMDQTEYEIEGSEKGSQDAQISATTEEKNIAPGSQLRFATIALSGTPEVAVEVTYTAELHLDNWKDQNNLDYCPLVFTVGTTEIKMDDKIDTVAKLEAAVVEAIVKYSESYEENTNLVSEKANQLTVFCQWAISSTGEDNDVKDTHLGNQAAVGNSPSIRLVINCTVSQVN